MKIEKLPSGSYRIRQQYKGKRYTVTVPYKPTQKEAMQLMSKQFDSVQIDRELKFGSFEEYVEKYIAYCEKSGKSPSTIRGYESIKRNLSDEFLESRFSDLESDDVQREIDRYSAERSAKSAKNAYGLVRSVFAKFRPEVKLTIKLPSAERKAEYEPTTKDIQRIIEASQGTHYSIALQLAVLGLRRGEILALTSADLSDDNILTINKDMVLDKDQKYVIKNSAKTEASNRRILIPQDLANEIRKQGYAFKGNPHTLNQYLHRCQDRLGIPRFRFHMMRHFCVAYLHKNGFTSEQIMQWGGWSTDSVMKRAYRYNLDPEESQAEISGKLGDLF